MSHLRQRFVSKKTPDLFPNVALKDRMSAQFSSGFNIESILERFPGPVTLQTATNFTPLHAVIFLGFTALFIFLIGQGSVFDLVLGWFGLVTCSLLTIIAAIGSFPASAALTLGAGGFQQRLLFMTFFRSLWRDVTKFEVATVVSPIWGGELQPVIWYHDQRRERWWPRMIWKMNRNAGVSPVEGLPIEQLAELMKRWREKALARESLQ